MGRKLNQNLAIHNARKSGQLRTVGRGKSTGSPRGMVGYNGANVGARGDARKSAMTGVKGARSGNRKMEEKGIKGIRQSGRRINQRRVGKKR